MQFEILYQELAGGVEVIRALVAGVTAEEARPRPAPESWSILEVICHLGDVEREDFRQRLNIILNRSDEKFPVIDPESWIIGRQYNERDLTEMVDKFVAERAQSLVWLKGLSEPDWETEYADEYGTMKAGELLAAWVAHDNLHMRQLVELRRARLVNLTAPYDVSYAGEW
jgi:hypothetical protein